MTRVQPNLVLAFRDGKISIRWLYDCVPGSTHRPQQWFDRLLRQAQRAPDEVKTLCRSEFFDGMRAVDGKLTPAEALTLLTFNANHGRYNNLIKEIEGITGVKLPIEPHKSKFEAAFGLRLEELLQELYSASGYVFREQKKIGPYYVDFYVEIHADGMPKYVIEFDEEAHDKKKHYLTHDPIRNRWFRDNRPDITFIRVKHVESETWLDAVSRTGAFISMEKFYAHCILSAAVCPTAQKLRITSQSAQAAYNIEQNQYAFLLTDPKHRLNELRKILNRLKVPHDGERVINLSKATLRRR
ncbi:hypothetical protein [Serratia fonticola]|uniref:hypothetical protein n=1 Tax=Serratia fonticola TaxID=47917 RepID=UPI000E0ECF89|nr:hypothetical protein [Serratia fonticola]RDL23582.1 hypothetical protein DFO62_10732 [Serratia fonticola]